MFRLAVRMHKVWNHVEYVWVTDFSSTGDRISLTNDINEARLYEFPPKKDILEFWETLMGFYLEIEEVEVF